jgi:hypothetical protein
MPNVRQTAALVAPASMAGTQIWRICGVARRAVLVPSPYAYQKASWLVPAEVFICVEFRRSGSHECIRPTTLAGGRAMAQASVAIAPLDIDGKPSCGGGDSEWLALVVVKFLAGSVVA